MVDPEVCLCVFLILLLSLTRSGIPSSNLALRASSLYFLFTSSIAAFIFSLIQTSAEPVLRSAICFTVLVTSLEALATIVFVIDTTALLGIGWLGLRVLWSLGITHNVAGASALVTKADFTRVTFRSPW